MGYLYGHTGRSFLDVWSIFHVSFWLVVGSVLWSRGYAAAKAGKPSRRAEQVLWCLSVSLLWEVFERYGEKHWPTYWLNPESWYNSWLSDPLTCVFGLLGSWYALDHWRKA